MFKIKKKRKKKKNEVLAKSEATTVTFNVRKLYKIE